MAQLEDERGGVSRRSSSAEATRVQWQLANSFMPKCNQLLANAPAAGVAACGNGTLCANYTLCVCNRVFVCVCVSLAVCPAVCPAVSMSLCV